MDDEVILIIVYNSKTFISLTCVLAHRSVVLSMKSVYRLCLTLHVSSNDHFGLKK